MEISPEELEALIQRTVSSTLANTKNRPRHYQKRSERELTEEQKALLARIVENDQAQKIAKQAIRNRHVLNSESYRLFAEADRLGISASAIAEAIGLGKSAVWSRIQTARKRTKSHQEQ